MPPKRREAPSLAGRYGHGDGQFAERGLDRTRRTRVWGSSGALDEDRRTFRPVIDSHMQRTAEQVWEACLEIIRDNVNRQSYATWFEPIRPVSLEEVEGHTRLTVRLPSQFYHEWLEQHYFGLIRKTISRVLGPTGRLVYKVVVDSDEADTEGSPGTLEFPVRPATETEGPSLAGIRAPRSREFDEEEPGGIEGLDGVVGEEGDMEDEEGPAVPAGPISPAFLGMGPLPTATNPFVIPGIRRVAVDPQLNPSYTFFRFVEGESNRLARGAAWTVAEHPGATAFNPLFLYGGVGSGKTHLIQAIGNHIREHAPSLNVLYQSSERFSNEFVQAVKHHRGVEFSQYYRQIDVLLVDDVQFLSGRERTQEEFFHIYNSLHQAGKQVVFTADRPPRELQGIEERLISRFQWGLTADLQPPEVEMRIAVLQRKAEEDGLRLPRDVIEFIAHNVRANIRELEGSLIRLLAYAAVRRKEIDLVLAREALRDLVGETPINITVDEIARIVCEYFHVPLELLKAKTRKREVVQARQLAMYFTKQFTKNSLKTIGLFFGGRDHSTVIHACQTVVNQIDTDPKFKEIVADIGHRINLRSR